MEHTIAPSDVSDLLRRPLSERSGSLIEGLHNGQCSSSTGKLCAKPHAKAHTRAFSTSLSLAFSDPHVTNGQLRLKEKVSQMET